jgi:hypothetical protein
LANIFVALSLFLLAAEFLDLLIVSATVDILLKKWDYSRRRFGVGVIEFGENSLMPSEILRFLMV